MKRTWTSDVGQWWNIVEIHHDERNSKMIWFWWRENEHQTLVNDEILLKFIMMREILKWSDFDEENKEYWTLVNDGNIVEIHHDERNSKTDLILMKRKRTSDVGQWWNIVEIHHDERNSKMIWFWWREKERLILMKRKRILDVGQCWNIVEIHHDGRNSKMIWFWWREKEHQTLVNDEILLKFIIFREILKWSDFDEENKNIGRWSMMEYCWNSSWWQKF